MTALPESGFAVRRAEIAANLERLKERIDAGCAAVGRASSEVTLIAVTKTYPAVDVQVVVSLGIKDVGENRAQELLAKRGELGATAASLGLVWHFIGQLQSNKAGDVVACADMVHSVDRASLISALARAAAQQNRMIDCLIQVSLDGVPGRGGAPPDQVLALAELIASTSHLTVRGLMAVAPLGGDARTQAGRWSCIYSLDHAVSMRPVLSTDDDGCAKTRQIT